MLRRPLSLACLAVIVLLLLGTKLASGFPSVYEDLEGRPVTVVGRVYQKECTNKAGKEKKVLYLQIISLDDGLHPADTGKERKNVICYLKADEELPQMGSTVKVKGVLKHFQEATNPGQFDAKSYYHILKISFQLNQTEIQGKSKKYNKFVEKLYEIRNYFSDILDHSLSEVDASLMKTMLLGEKGAADSDLKAVYQRNGIAHVLAISGLHISLLGMTLYRLLKKTGCPLFLQTGLPAGVIILYCFMTGFSVSSMRAVIMFGIHMLALLCKRTYDMITAAFVAAVLLLLDQPLYFYSSSFLFSFGCIFAIGFLVPALTQELKSKEKQPGTFLKSFLSGAALTMAGIPLQLCFFYQMPVYSTLLNLLVIPLMSFLLPAGIVLLMLWHLSPIVELAGTLITGILAVFESACTFAETLPFHTVLTGKPENYRILLYLAALLLAIVLQEKICLWKRWVIILCGAVLLFLPGKRELTLTFLDVGQGDCIHIKTMEGNHFLVDGGSSSVSQVGTYRIIPYLKASGAGEIEAVFVTHPDEDHCNGVRELLSAGALNGIHVKKLYLPDVGENARSQAYEALVTEAADAGVPVDYIHKGQALLEKEFTLFCLHPEEGDESRESNEYSMVLLLCFREFRALLTGDVEGDGEEKLIQSLEDMKTGKYGDTSLEGAVSGGYGKVSLPENGITVLKVAHHGSGNSTPMKLLTEINPQIAVISCGENNPYGHPHSETLNRLGDVGAAIYRTDVSGAVEITVDKKGLLVSEYLK